MENKHNVEAGDYVAGQVRCYHLLKTVNNGDVMWIYVDVHKQCLLFRLFKVFFQIICKEILFRN